MVAANPHFLLFCDGQCAAQDSSGSAESRKLRGTWHFVLERLDDDQLGSRLEATDTELVASRERAAILSVVRGLEALEQPSKVTLVTTSRYVSRGLRYGLNSWRDSGYKWERFGVQTPIRNADLWQRIDQALSYHGVHCKLLQGDQSRSPIQQLLYPDPYQAAVVNPQNGRVSLFGEMGRSQGDVQEPEQRFQAQLGSQNRGAFSRFRKLPNDIATCLKNWWRRQSPSPNWAGS